MASYMMDKKGTAQHPLHNRTLHISRAIKPQQKTNIGAGKANIEEIFKPKAAAHIRKLQETFGLQTVFGRSDVQKALGLKPTRSSALLRDLEEQGSLSRYPVTEKENTDFVRFRFGIIQPESYLKRKNKVINYGSTRCAMSALPPDNGRERSTNF